MEVQNNTIDGGVPFDWDRAAPDYAQYRDIYPAVFYQKILDRGLCVQGQRVLDLGTGTGVLPRNLYQYGADWTGIDCAPQQIAQAERLSAQQGQQIRYLALPAEEIAFPDRSFEVVTACQCFWYFNHAVLIPKLARTLTQDGTLLLLYLAWLPFEDAIAGQSEALVLQYSPHWTGAGETIHPIRVPDCVLDAFLPVYHEEYPLELPFTRESWHGRMRACRGVGASLSEDALSAWDRDHRQLLKRIAPETFSIRHYAAMLELRCKK